MQRIFRASALGAAILFLGTGLAHAVLPPGVYQKARAEAAYHVQVAIDGVKVPAETPGACEVSGKIVQIFRDTQGNLKDGETISFPIDCIRSDAEAFPGPAQWTGVNELDDARFIEVYLNDEDDGLKTARWQSRIIEEPSPNPQLPVE